MVEKLISTTYKVNIAANFPLYWLMHRWKWAGVVSDINWCFSWPYPHRETFLHIWRCSKPLWKWEHLSGISNRHWVWKWGSHRPWWSSEGDVLSILGTGISTAIWGYNYTDATNSSSDGYDCLPCAWKNPLSWLPSHWFSTYPDCSTNTYLYASWSCYPLWHNGRSISRLSLLCGTGNYKKKHLVTKSSPMKCRVCCSTHLADMAVARYLPLLTYNNYCNKSLSMSYALSQLLQLLPSTQGFQASTLHSGTT